MCGCGDVYTGRGRCGRIDASSPLVVDAISEHIRAVAHMRARDNACVGGTGFSRGDVLCGCVHLREHDRRHGAHERQNATAGARTANVCAMAKLGLRSFPMRRRARTHMIGAIE